MASIQGGPRTARSGDYSPRSWAPHGAWSQLAGKFPNGPAGLYFSMKQPAILGRSRAQGEELRP